MSVRRFARLSLAAALIVLPATGCGATTHTHGAKSRPGRFPVVVAHPAVQTTGLASLKLSQDTAEFLSPSRLAFVTSGSTSCVWLPARLTILGPSSIRVDMHLNGDVGSCAAGAVGFPIAVKIDPRLVDVHRPLTVRLAYTVRLPGSEGTKRSTRTAVAPALAH